MVEVKTEAGRFLKTKGNLFKGKSEEEREAIKREIRTGFEHGLSEEQILLYATSDYSSLQMQAIRVAIEEGIPKSYILEKIALKSKSPEAMLESKIQYFNSKAGVKNPEVVNGAYIQKIHAQLSLLETRIDTQQSFFDQITQRLELENTQLKEELQVTAAENKVLKEQLLLSDRQKGEESLRVQDYERKCNHLKEQLSALESRNQVLERARTEREETPRRKRQSLFFCRKRESLPDWFLEVLVTPGFSLEQMSLLTEAYHAGIKRNILLKLASPEIEASHMKQVIGMFVKGGEKEGSEINATK
ncbi:hypothetical protein M2454_000224 [Aequitasia blattaphilus]|uniref:Uncharacterized protein n=2 Tax=Lachnospiraceae TaxID=186803 RepID=A0ABT1EFX3_9FIRM|nr:MULTISPECIES: hypothetical protein [Lachnospiraceae]MCP1101005.1 hypothetical protein [Aequitasia blattaphilus]MCP1109598.1 hypothetical protein [Ohessyouella blattaphilus]MCR8562992.1 hypothetical protein [Ohessyouella blattaphilus]MCR8613645.1 hypothetical protein [Aequitasia blattaphilus]